MLEAEGDDQDQGHGDGAVPGVALQKRTSFLMNLLSSHETGDWRNPGNTLYVTGLPGWATERNLRELFRTQGEVIDCHLIRNYSTNESCGYAFVTMATKADAERCIQYFHHSVHFGRVIVVEVVIFSYWFQNESNQKFLLSDKHSLISFGSRSSLLVLPCH
ncbi:serine/arginine-rich splicing factor SR45a-like [Vigna unguiculata]|uniref:serine/arginine-rich splicing factor SR45a-like n=1 Tax=Vigna unguiculata TaxID=3917 RepID=UPI00101680FB|nr:serine/arginine-rich splicing factor SR45a-like [Vigna unguiculata]